MRPLFIQTYIDDEGIRGEFVFSKGDEQINGKTKGAELRGPFSK